MSALHTWQSHRSPGGLALKTNPLWWLWRLSCFLHCAVCFAKKLESHLSSAATLFFHWCCHTHFFQQTSFATMLERDQCSWLSHPTVITSSSLLASQGHVHTSGLDRRIGPGCHVCILGKAIDHRAAQRWKQTPSGGCDDWVVFYTVLSALPKS